MMVLILAFFVILYVISFGYCIKWFRKAYSKTGRWPTLKPAFQDVFFTVVPIVNTVAMIALLLDSPYKESQNDKPEKDYSDFFGVNSKKDQK